VLEDDGAQIPGFKLSHRLMQAERRFDLADEIRRRRDDDEFPPELYEFYGAFYRAETPAQLSDPQTLVVVATPQCQASMLFHWQADTVQLLVPPTYASYVSTREQVQTQLTSLLAPLGWSVGPARVPQKLAAARSGLVRYGRNNVTYCGDAGSMIQLSSFYTDMPCEHESWGHPQLLERCATCNACVRACPSGALTAGRFIVRQDRCITFYSGYSGPTHLPDWLDHAWLETLVGCPRCQRACPQNRHWKTWVDTGPEFDAEETRSLRDGLRQADVSAALRAKLDASGLVDFFGFDSCLEMLSVKLQVLLPV
jgi:epoxyqueuosine reductase